VVGGLLSLVGVGAGFGLAIIVGIIVGPDRHLEEMQKQLAEIQLRQTHNAEAAERAGEAAEAAAKRAAGAEAKRAEEEQKQDLETVTAAWPTLPAAIRAGIVATVRAAR
jgi:hypothetical protein